jgi:hypothetical protein
MPKLGDIKKMDEDGDWGLWDGYFWSKIQWHETKFSGGGWFIRQEILDRITGNPQKVDLELDEGKNWRQDPNES